jgi:hypothetical protein
MKAPDPNEAAILRASAILFARGWDRVGVTASSKAPGRMVLGARSGARVTRVLLENGAFTVAEIENNVIAREETAPTVAAMLAYCETRTPHPAGSREEKRALAAPVSPPMEE